MPRGPGIRLDHSPDGLGNSQAEGQALALSFAGCVALAKPLSFLSYKVGDKSAYLGSELWGLRECTARLSVVCGPGEGGTHGSLLISSPSRGGKDCHAMPSRGTRGKSRVLCWTERKASSGRWHSHSMPIACQPERAFGLGRG